MLRFFEEKELPGRVAGFADELRSIRHTGWYSMDDDFGETFRGVVIRLAGGRGFLIGYYESMSEGYVLEMEVWPKETFEEPGECAFAADDLARNEAERSRELCRVENIKYQIEEERAELGPIREEIRAMIRVLRSGVQSLAYCESVIRDLLSQRSETIARIEGLKENI